MVINNHTVKPMDDVTIVEAARQCGAIVTVEEHQVHAGMGSRIAEILAQQNPVPIEFVGVHDQFGQSGDPAELIEHYGMGTTSIKEAVRRVRRRK
jgi:transketolase